MDGGLNMENKLKLQNDDIQSKVLFFLENKDKLQIDTMFVKKTTSKKQKYITYMFECRNDDIINVVEATLTTILKILDKRVICDYDLEISLDESIQIVDCANVVHGEEILGQMTIDHNEKNTLSGDVNFSRLDFLIIKLFIPNGEEMYLCKKHIKNATGYRKNACNFAFNGKEYKLLGENILAIGEGIDAFLVNGYYYIANRNNFNSMFDYKDVFHKIVKDNKDKICEMNILYNANEFLDKCEKDGRYLPRLTKAILADGFQNLEQNRENIKETVKEFGLKVEVDESNSILYDESSDISEILNLLLEHYVKSALSSKKMIAAAIEKYQV